jgi:hypothetical protein
MSLDDRISRGLATMTERVDPDAQEALPEIFRRQRRKVVARALGTAGVTGLAVAVALVVVPAALPDREPPPFGIGTPTPGEIVGPPEEFVVATTNTIKIYSTVTGKPVRTLYASEEYRIRGIALTADLEWVLFGRELTLHGRSGGRVNEVLAVPFAGGIPEPIASGHSPALSPAELVEGRWRGKDVLAYVGAGSLTTTPNGELTCSTNEPIVTTDTVEPPSRPTEIGRWPWSIGEGDPNDPYVACSGPNALARSLGDKVAYDRNVGDPLYEVWVLDVCCDPKNSRDIILDSTRVETDRSIRSPAFLPDGDLLVVEDIGVHSEDPRSAVWLVDGDTLQPLKKIFTSEGVIGSVRYDKTSAHLIVAEQGACGARCLRISTWTGVALEEIAQIELGPDDYAIAAW